MDPATGAGYASVLYAIAGAEAVNTGGAAPETLGVRAVDARTLEITLANPTPYFLNLLTHQTALPLHRASVAAHGDAFTKAGNLVSNGAFMLESFVPNDRIVMAKNPNFHDAANVALDAINYIPFEDRSACLRRFEAGEVHICSDVPAEQMTYMRETMGGQLRVAPYLGTYYLPIKTTKPAFSDPRVRQALSMLIDRDFIAREVWQGTMVPAWSFVPPGIDNYLDNQPLLAYRDMDPLDREDAALALLKQAGVDPAALSIELRYNSSENNKNTMAAVADMLSQVGVSARLNEMEGSSYFNYLREDGVDRRLQRSAELPVPVRNRRLVQLSALVERGVRRKAACGGEGDRPRRPRGAAGRGGADLSGGGSGDPDPVLLLARAGVGPGFGLGGQSARQPRVALAEPELTRAAARGAPGGCSPIACAG